MTAIPSARPQEVRPALTLSGRNSRTGAGYPVVMTRRGLQFSRPLSFDRWLNIGRRLSDMCTSSAWYLGDWLIYGEAAFSGRYRTAIEQTSLNYQTLRNYAWVSKRFQHSRRRDTLSFGHHAEVASLPEPEQDFWLCKAEEFGWSVKQLRREVRESLRERSADGRGQLQADSDEHRAGPRVIRLNIKVSPDQLETCRVTAQSLGLSVEEWVALALEQAVRRGLNSASHIRDDDRREHLMP